MKLQRELDNRDKDMEKGHSEKVVIAFCKISLNCAHHIYWVTWKTKKKVFSISNANTIIEMENI